jgi:YidC/Oxa1 family membrane protein insertase
VDLQVLPKDTIQLVQSAPYATKPQNVYIDEAHHYPIAAFLPGGNKIVEGQKIRIDLQTTYGRALEKVASEEAPENSLKPTYEVVKGQERVKVNADGSVEAIAGGDASVKVTVPGIAANTGFLFIKALGRIGATGPDGEIHWDILAMVIFFGLSIYVNQELSGTGAPSSGAAPQQQTVNKITPVIFSMMFLFFPLPAGVLMYILVANIFQTAQTVILMREPLPENLQKLVAQQEKAERSADREALPFEKRSNKKKEKTS